MLIKKIVQFVIASGFILTFAAFSFAQDATSQAATAQASPDPQQQQEEKAKLERKANALLEQVIAEAQSLKLPENRIRVQITAGDMLWDRNAARARFVYGRRHGTGANERRCRSHRPQRDASAESVAAGIGAHCRATRRRTWVSVAAHDATTSRQRRRRQTARSTKRIGANVALNNCGERSKVGLSKDNGVARQRRISRLDKHGVGPAAIERRRSVQETFGQSAQQVDLGHAPGQSQRRQRGNRPAHSRSTSGKHHDEYCQRREDLESAKHPAAGLERIGVSRFDGQRDHGGAHYYFAGAGQ